MSRAFAYVRHGYRSTNSTTPQRSLVLTPSSFEKLVCLFSCVQNVDPLYKPSTVNMPSMGGAFAETLLNGSLPRTLPAGSAVGRIGAIHAGRQGARVRGLGVFALPTNRGGVGDVFKRVSTGNRALIAILMQAYSVWSAHTNRRASRSARQSYRGAGRTQRRCLERRPARSRRQVREPAHAVWHQLLTRLGFERTRAIQESMTETSPTASRAVDGRARALGYLELPLTTFTFASTVIMSFALSDVTAFQILESRVLALAANVRRTQNLDQRLGSWRSYWPSGIRENAALRGRWRLGHVSSDATTTTSTKSSIQRGVRARGTDARGLYRVRLWQSTVPTTGVGVVIRAQAALEMLQVFCLSIELSVTGG